MIPEGGSISNAQVQEVQQPSLTWKIDFERGRIVGKTDGLDAVRQAVFKVLQSDRYWYDIYSFDYGHELATLVGGNPIYVQSEVSRMISEALLQDDRITAIEDMGIVVSGESLTARFTVVTQYGSFQEEVIRDV